MSKKTRLRRTYFVILVIITISSIVIFTRPWQSAARPLTPSVFQSDWEQSLKDGLGSVQLSDSDSVASFIYRRSGTALSLSVKESLAKLQGAVENGSRRKFSAADLSAILTQTWLEDVDALSDGDIAYISQNMRTVPVWDKPGDVVTMLRETGGIILPPNEFVAQAKAFRNQSTADAAQWRAASQTRIQDEIQNRLADYSRVIPSWSQVLSNGLTPSQAILVVYSIASDDPMGGSDAALRNSMASVHNFCSQAHEGEASFPQRLASSQAALQTQTAYGTSGYLFSSPLNFFFDENTLIRLLKRVDERI